MTYKSKYAICLCWTIISKKIPAVTGASKRCFSFFGLMSCLLFPPTFLLVLLQDRLLLITHPEVPTSDHIRVLLHQNPHQVVDGTVVAETAQ